ncbi:MAG: CBS domain-containing protein, partial [Candidatus Zixiibacteriota bacterium]
MKAKDILQVKQREPITVSPKTSLKEAMKLLITNRISCLPVLSDDSQLVGIISDKDIFKAIYENPDGFSAMPVSDNMSTNLIVGLADDELNYIAGLMTNNRIRPIPIVK